jgi:hypothetical protein
LTADTTSECSQGGFIGVYGWGFTPGGQVHYVVDWPVGAPFGHGEYTYDIQADGIIEAGWGWKAAGEYSGTFTMTATDLATGCVVTLEVAIAPCG